MKENAIEFDISITCFIDKHTDEAVCLQDTDMGKQHKGEEVTLPSIDTTTILDKEKLTNYLFQALNAMDIIITSIATRGMGNSVKMLLNIKDGTKGMVLNISNDDLNATENIILGGVAITISVIVGVIAGEWILAVFISILIGVYSMLFLQKFINIIMIFFSFGILYGLYMTTSLMELIEAIKKEWATILFFIYSINDMGIYFLSE
ncbi:hypothetical protein OQH61_05790 [Helicobacter sp. MIT 21-1697]|uniref:hypothetical protein n=1 Tax=Helicobacter sp. MIT 21-1697 TaxID=2993733 RepID=UPI00224AA8A8|nr:hypothetical protein [Helicobacter sp. MIT 21-1697]MCX2717246.1 hypothetical protein [Helicobacter sp. MIT 21-1697]